MNRLQSELLRLYGLPDAPRAGRGPAMVDLVAPDGAVRALVVALSAPAEWQPLAALWQGVQADLEWPAPAIAVAGDAGMQLWFSLAQPCPAAQAAALLQTLRHRWLRDLRPDRISLWPVLAHGEQPVQVHHAEPVPAALPADGHWSAFVAPDLAPMFVDEPWLDLPPNPEGQADLLARLRSITPRELQRLPLAVEPAPSSGCAAGAARAAGRPDNAPYRFLLKVMNDESVDLALRIEAAKALLPLGHADTGPADA